MSKLLLATVVVMHSVTGAWGARDGQGGQRRREGTRHWCQCQPGMVAHLLPLCMQRYERQASLVSSEAKAQYIKAAASRRVLL